jgi:hypothetical protein
MWIRPEPNGRIMKQTAFWREKNGECAARLKFSVHIFVDWTYHTSVGYGCGACYI